jgi:hypothetical protein
LPQCPKKPGHDPNEDEEDKEDEDEVEDEDAKV